MTAVVPTTPTSFLANVFETAVRHARNARARRAQRIALMTLLDMDASRLDDLGLNVQDVVDALDAPPPATRVLEARRARRAATWASENALADA